MAVFRRQHNRSGHDTPVGGSTTKPRRNSPRRMLVASALMSVTVWAIAPAAHADDLGANKSDLIRNLLPTVVNILVRKDELANPPAPVSASGPGPGATGSGTTGDRAIKSYVGSGFVIDPTGVIVTNYHVVEDAFEITVTFSDGSRQPGKFMSASRLADIALVKVDADHPLAAAHWGNSDRLQVGDQVFAAGNPFGIGLSVSAGIVSGLNRDIQDSPYDDFIQTDASINHGNSGGPLFDMQGSVVGVNSTIISPTSGSSGLGFAIPAANARFVTDRLRTYGWVRPSWVGVKVQTVTPDIAIALGLPRAEGSIVSWVLPAGPAMKAGLEIGDVILRFNGTTPTDDRALLRDIAQSSADDKMTLTLRRANQERDVVVTAEAWPRNQWDARDAPVLVQRPKMVIPPDLGLSLSTPDADERAKLGLEDGLTGVEVTDVAVDSDTARRGITSGDVILRVQDKPVATPQDVQSGIDAARANKRDFVLMLVLPKVRAVAGPKWVPLQTGTTGG